MAAFVPDVSGFVEAQGRLTQYLGTPVTFTFAPTSVSYSSGTYVDPETGLALDPTVEPVTEIVPADQVVTATVVRKVPTLGGAGSNDGIEQSGGLIPEGRIWLRIPEGTYDDSILAAARFQVGDEIFRIDRTVRDYIAGSAHCVYIEGELAEEGALTPVPSGGTSSAAGSLIREQFVAASGQTTFTMATGFVDDSTIVSVDGLAQTEGVGFDYAEVLPDQVVFYNGLEADQNVIVVYVAL